MTGSKEPWDDDRRVARQLSSPLRRATRPAWTLGLEPHPPRKTRKPRKRLSIHAVRLTNRCAVMF